MYKYKTVPAPSDLIIKSGKDKARISEKFEDLINRECAGGWEFYSMETVTASLKSGFFGTDGLTHFDMLIFRKEER
jgi:hypothetical protein